MSIRELRNYTGLRPARNTIHAGLIVGILSNLVVAVLPFVWLPLSRFCG